MSEATDIINIDIPREIPGLVRRVKEYDGHPAEAYFGHGIALRVTTHMAQIVAEDPDDETLAALEDSGRSFRVIR
jgi:hypothetical protein